MKLKFGQVILLVWALVVAAGGVMGYVKAQSLPSLVAGIVCGALLFGSYWVSRRYLLRGYRAGIGVSAVLAVTFGWRLWKTGAFMPSGLMLILSVVVLVALFAITTRRDDE